jgi:signal transduction histidine kinase
MPHRRTHREVQTGELEWRGQHPGRVDGLADCVPAPAAADAVDAEAPIGERRHYLATMSHELRTPINAVLGYAELMTLGITGPVTDMQVAQLARVRACAMRLTNLISDVLDLAEVLWDIVPKVATVQPVDLPRRDAPRVVRPR